MPIPAVCIGTVAHPDQEQLVLCRFHGFRGGPQADRFRRRGRRAPPHLTWSAVSQLFLKYEYYVAALQLILAMTGMGATLAGRDFHELIRSPKSIAWGLLVQVVGIPLLAWLIIRGLDLPASLAVGLAIVACVPGGSMSNILSYFARGNIALSIALTGVTTVICLVTAPLILHSLTAGLLSASAEIPVQRIAFEIFVLLLLPLTTGMLIRRHRPDIAKRIAKPLVRASLVIVLVMAVGIGTAGRIDPAAFGWIGPALIFGFGFAAFAIGFFPGSLLGVPRRDRIAIGIESCFRNTSLGILIKASILPAIPGVVDPIADGAIFVVLLYGGVSLSVCVPAMFWHRRLSQNGAAESRG